MRIIIGLLFVSFVLLVACPILVANRYYARKPILGSFMVTLLPAVLLFSFVLWFTNTLPFTTNTVTYSDYTILSDSEHGSFGYTEVSLPNNEVRTSKGKVFVKTKTIHTTSSKTGKPYVEVVYSSLDKPKLNGLQKFIVGDEPDRFTHVEEMTIYE